MTTKKQYTYVVLRYRHDPLAGEFANVGVLLHAPGSSFLGIRVRRTVGRLSVMFPGLSGDALKGTLRAIERGISQLAKREASSLLAPLGDAGTYARRALPNEDSSFVWGPVGSGVASDPRQALENLYSRFVSQYDEKSRAHRDDAAVWKPVRDLLVQRHLDDRLQSVTIRSDLDEIDFEHAWKNGAWHCYQPLSFDLASGESIREKASKWAGQLLALSSAQDTFRAHFVVGAPQTTKLQDDYRKAMAILQLGPGNPEVIEEDDASVLVDRLEREIGGQHP